jgi:hypothetical protein
VTPIHVPNNNVQALFILQEDIRGSVTIEIATACNFPVSPTYLAGYCEMDVDNGCNEKKPKRDESALLHVDSNRFCPGSWNRDN